MLYCITRGKMGLTKLINITRANFNNYFNNCPDNDLVKAKIWTGKVDRSVNWENNCFPLPPPPHEKYNGRLARTNVQCIISATQWHITFKHRIWGWESCQKWNHCTSVEIWKYKYFPKYYIWSYFKTSLALFHIKSHVISNLEGGTIMCACGGIGLGLNFLPYLLRHTGW